MSDEDRTPVTDLSTRRSGREQDSSSSGAAATPDARQADEDYDITELPNFKALREWLDKNYGGQWSPESNLAKWIDKLERWCELSIEAGTQDKDEIEGLQQEQENLVEQIGELEGTEDELEHLRTVVQDIPRGIRSFEELLDTVIEGPNAVWPSSGV